MDQIMKKNSWYIKAICLVFSICFFAASLAATIYLNLWGHVWKDFLKIMTTPGPLITDYFMLGNIASSFLNAGMCGLSMTLIMIFMGPMRLFLSVFPGQVKLVQLKFDLRFKICG